MTNVEKFPVIHVQQSILTTFLELVTVTEQCLAKMKKAGYLESYEVQLVPYNAGYEIKTNVKVSYKTYTHYAGHPRVEKYLNLLNSFTGFYLYPDVFFNERFAEKLHGAEISGKLPSKTFETKFVSKRFSDFESIRYFLQSFQDQALTEIEGMCAW